MEFDWELSSDLIIILAVVALAVFALGIFIGTRIKRSTGKVGDKKGTQNTRREGERGNYIEKGRLQNIFDLISSLTATLNYQRVMDLALDLSATALGTSTAPAEHLVSGVLLYSPPVEGKQAQLTVEASRRFTPADARSVLPGTKGLLGQVFEEGKPIASKDFTHDPELGRMVALRACKIVYCIPLRHGLDTYGVLLYAHPDPNFFTTSQREILGIIAHQAVIAIQNALLYRDLGDEKERMMDIQEEARKKLARDLHDGPTQSVAAIAMRVNFARRLMERDVKAAAEELFKIEDLARRTTGEIRHMLFTLRPLVLESQGLVAALQAMADKMRETYNQNVIIEADDKVIPDLEMGKQAVIFYIVEEAVNNARKHAQAAHIWVRLKPLEEGVVLLEIEDDGVGFDVGAVDSTYEKRGSLGLVNIRERAELVNGIPRIDSAEGKGTRIRVVIPLNEEAADRLRRGG
jgi:signal transduction histidine kinase